MERCNISLIPKEGQDLTNAKNYRPISLLNNDYTLFTRILAERIKFFLQHFIGEDCGGSSPKGGKPAVLTPPSLSMEPPPV